MRVHLQDLRQWKEDRGVSFDKARELEAYITDYGVSLYANGTFTECDNKQVIRLTKSSAVLLAKTILTLIIGKD